MAEQLAQLLRFIVTMPFGVFAGRLQPWPVGWPSTPAGGSHSGLTVGHIPAPGRQPESVVLPLLMICAHFTLVGCAPAGVIRLLGADGPILRSVARVALPDPGQFAKVHLANDLAVATQPFRGFAQGRFRCAADNKPQRAKHRQYPHFLALPEPWRAFSGFTGMVAKHLRRTVAGLAGFAHDLATRAVFRPVSGSIESNGQLNDSGLACDVWNGVEPPVAPWARLYSANPPFTYLQSDRDLPPDWARGLLHPAGKERPCGNGRPVRRRALQGNRPVALGDHLPHARNGRSFLPAMPADHPRHHYEQQLAAQSLARIEQTWNSLVPCP